MINPFDKLHKIFDTRRAVHITGLDQIWKRAEELLDQFLQLEYDEPKTEEDHEIIRTACFLVVLEINRRQNERNITEDALKDTGSAESIDK